MTTLCDKERCSWQTADGLCPPFRGGRCPFGGGTIICREDGTPAHTVTVDAGVIAERICRRRHRVYDTVRRKAERR